MNNISEIGRGIMRVWWIPLITGLIGIALGVWCLFDPSESLTIFAYVFAGLLCAAGLLNLVYAGMNKSFARGNWGWSLALGLLDIFCGVWLFTLPQAVVVSTFIFVVGVWILVVAINSICESYALSAFSRGWIVWMVLLLIGTIFFAFYFLSGPVSGGVIVWLYLGIALITFGAYRVGLAFQLRSITKKL